MSSSKMSVQPRSSLPHPAATPLCLHLRAPQKLSRVWRGCPHSLRWPQERPPVGLLQSTTQPTNHSRAPPSRRQSVQSSRESVQSPCSHTQPRSVCASPGQPPQHNTHGGARQPRQAGSVVASALSQAPLAILAAASRPPPRTHKRRRVPSGLPCLLSRWPHHHRVVACGPERPRRQLPAAAGRQAPAALTTRTHARLGGTQTPTESQTHTDTHTHGGKARAGAHTPYYAYYVCGAHTEGR